MCLEIQQWVNYSLELLRACSRKVRRTIIMHWLIFAHGREFGKLIKQVVKTA